MEDPSSCSSSLDDPTNPLYIHHSNSHGVSLVSFPLTGENFPAWHRVMHIALTVKNKLGFMDGSIPRPMKNSSLIATWNRCNNIVLAWILNSVSKEISSSIMYSEFASEVWKDLEDTFQQQNRPHIFQLRKDLVTISQNQSSVSAYFTKLKGVWEELSNFRPQCTCGKCCCGGVEKLQQFNHLEYIITFLMGLNENYSSIRGQLLLMDPLPNMSKVFSLVTQEERQRQISLPSETASGVVFASKTNNGRLQEFKNKNLKNFTKSKLFCTHCNMSGHTIERCYKLHGYPPGYKKGKSGSSTINMVTDQAPQLATIPGDFFKSLSSDQVNQLMIMLGIT